MTNKTKSYKVVTRRLHKTRATNLYILLPFAYKWLPIFNNLRMRHIEPSRFGTAHRKFWRRDD